MWTRSLIRPFVRIILINLIYRIIGNCQNIIRNLKLLNKFRKNENTSCCSTDVDVKMTAQMFGGMNLSFDITK